MTAPSKVEVAKYIQYTCMYVYIYIICMNTVQHKSANFFHKLSESLGKVARASFEKAWKTANIAKQDSDGYRHFH